MKGPLDLYGTGLYALWEGHPWTAVMLVHEGQEQVLALQEVLIGDVVVLDACRYRLSLSQGDVPLRDVQHCEPYLYAARWCLRGGQTGYTKMDGEHPFGPPDLSIEPIFPLLMTLLVRKVVLTEISF